MSTYLFIFCIILFFILSTIFIKDYNNSVRKKMHIPLVMIY